MTALRTIVASSLGLAAAALADGANAAVLTYYYVSAPYVTSNFDGDAPLFTTGYIAIDEAKMPGGSVAGQTVQPGAWEDSSGDWPSYVTAMEFRSGDRVVFGSNWATYRDSYIQFDETKRISGWEIFHAFDDGLETGKYGERTFDFMSAGWSIVFDKKFYTPGVKGCGWDDDESDCFGGQIDAYLKRLGYKEGTAKYDRYANEYSWGTYFSADAALPGLWFDNPNDYAAQVAAYTKHALAHPPRNVYDIQPVPLPAAGALLIGGLGVLAAAKRRRAV